MKNRKINGDEPRKACTLDPPNHCLNNISEYIFFTDSFHARPEFCWPKERERQTITKNPETSAIKSKEKNNQINLKFPL